MPRVVIGLVVAVSIGFAVAAFVIRAAIEGGVDAPPFEPASGGASVINASDGMTCLVGYAGTKMTLQINGAYPDGSCVIRAFAYVPMSAAEDGKLVGIDLNLPNGWSTTFPTPGDCGKTIVKRGDGGSMTPLIFEVTMGPEATTGATSTFTGNGLLIKPVSSGAPLQCS